MPSSGQTTAFKKALPCLTCTHYQPDPQLWELQTELQLPPLKRTFESFFFWDFSFGRNMSESSFPQPQPPVCVPIPMLCCFFLWHCKNASSCFNCFFSLIFALFPRYPHLRWQMLYCERGHLLYPQTLKQLQSLGSGYRGGYLCDSCRKGSVLELFHCDKCNFDLCRPCGMKAMQLSHCPENHQLLRLVREDLESGNKKKSSWECSKCHKSDSFSFMLCCPACQYFMCPECYSANVVCCH